MDRSQAPAAITAAAQHYGVSPALALAVAQAESGVNPNVRDGGAGEVGMFQLMPGTAQFLGVSNPRDPSQNIDGGVRLLRWLLDRYGGDARKALQAYNGGWGWVDKGDPKLAARAYAENVLKLAGGAAVVGPIVAVAAPPPAVNWGLPAFPSGELPEVPFEIWIGLTIAGGAWLLLG